MDELRMGKRLQEDAIADGKEYLQEEGTIDWMPQSREVVGIGYRRS